MVTQGIFLPNIQIPLPLAILLIGGITSPLIGLISEKIKIEKLREIWTLIVVLTSTIPIITLYIQLQEAPNNIILMTLWGQNPPLGGCFEIDMLSLFMSGSISILGILVSIYSISYMANEDRLTEFYTLVIFMLAGMTGVAFAGDFFTLFVFWELMTLSSYVLVAFLKSSWGPIEAGFKYLIMSATAGAFLLLSMAILYGLGGTLNFAVLSASLRGASITPWIMILFSTLIIGFGVKAAIVPLHTWLPDAHPEAPSPISALLSGIVIETGLYAMVRVLFILFEPSVYSNQISILAAITMTVANISALLQNDIKRMLAYSSIAQVGYMLVGLSTGTTYGIMALFFHVFSHALMKGMAFLSAGSIVHEAGTRDINQLQGIGKMMPMTTLSLFIALLGLGGVPGTSGFMSKFMLFASAFQVELAWLGILGILNSILSMGYYLRVMKSLVSSPREGLHAREAPTLMVSVTVVMAVLIILVGFWPSLIFNYADSAAQALVDGLANYIAAVL
jgi:proton-translocating NADH-quinone oxidoreductase chain N